MLAAFDAGDRSVSPQQPERINDLWADGGAGDGDAEGDADRLGELAEADDLVRRLWHPPTPFEPEAVERSVTDALLLLAESEEHDESTAEALRRLAASVSDTLVSLGLVHQARCVLPNRESDPVPSGGVSDMTAPPCDDDAPGTAFGEGDGTTPLRFDLRYERPVAVTLQGEKANAIWPPSFGRVRLRPDGSRRSVVVALDELDDSSRRILRTAPVRLRAETIVRCSVRHCNQCCRAWILEGSPPDDFQIEDTKGDLISEFAGLFAARCEQHRLTP